MAAITYVVDTTAAIAQYLTDTVTVAGGRVNITEHDGYVTAQIDEAAYAWLTALSEDSDGHVDSEGRLWIGGDSDQFTQIIA